MVIMLGYMYKSTVWASAAMECCVDTMTSPSFQKTDEKQVYIMHAR